MIDFKQLHSDVKAYIKTNMKTVLEDLEVRDFDAYIDDYVDLDSYKKPRQLFYEFGSYGFDPLTNETESSESTLTLTLSFIGQKPSDLSDAMLVYTMAVQKMFDDSGCNFGGIYDFGIIDGIRFYQAAEGDRCKKVAEISFRMTLES